MGKSISGMLLFQIIEKCEILKYCEEFISPLKHHMQSIEAYIQDSTTFLATGRSEEDASNLVSLYSIDIAPINRDILKRVEGRKINGNRHMTSVIGD